MLAKLLLVVFVGLAVAERDYTGYSFEHYLREFSKSYASRLEYTLHSQLFHERLAEIVSHNSNPHKSYEKGVNKFTDMTESELKSFRGYKFVGNATNPCTYVAPQGSPPSAIDWRQKPNVVSPVKDQGQCGSCWAFATAETIESQLGLLTGNMTILSPQDVVSCTPNPYHCGGTGGCNGATAELGFTYVQSAGIATNQNWPYTATTGTCNAAQHQMVASVTGCVKLLENNYTDLLMAVASIGPIAVSVDASRWSSYSKGVYDGCDTEVDYDIDHAVQLVGYGTDNSYNPPKDYWIVRNSWGSSWGENGFIRLLRHSDGSSQWCKKDVTPSDGSGCDGGPATVTVCGECGIWYDSSYPTGARYL
jgi:cathepsin L